MNLSSITLAFSDLFKLKKITIQNFQPILQAFYYQLDKGSLIQKVSIISTITYFFQYATKY
jgi:hypothetical protein